MNGAVSGWTSVRGSDSEPQLEVVGVFSSRGERGGTEWLSIELAVHSPITVEELEIEGRFWAPGEGRWMRTWDIRHAAADGSLVRRVSFGPVDAGQELRLELAVPSWALLAPQTVTPVEVLWDLRVFDASGTCVDTARSEPYSVVLPVRSSWAGPLAHAQLAAALGVATASADGPITPEEEGVIRLAALEATGHGGGVRRMVVDVVDCLIDEPVAAWEYLEAFLNVLRPDGHRIDELIDLAVRVATVDGPVGAEESILIGELRRRLQEQRIDEIPVGTYCIDLDHMELMGPDPRDVSLPPSRVSVPASATLAHSSPLRKEEADAGSAAAAAYAQAVPADLGRAAETGDAVRDLCDLYEVLSECLARQAGFGKGEHRPRPETLVSLLEETGTLSRDMALEVRFVTNLCARVACGEPVGEQKVRAALDVGRDVLRGFGV